MSRPRRWWPGVLLAVALCTAACSSGDDGADAPASALEDSGEERAGAGTSAGFYEPPRDLAAAAPGDLLRAEPVEVPGFPGRLWRVLYRSAAVDGSPTAVSGIVAAPAAESAADLGVVSLGVWTSGSADSCAPSRTPAAVSAVLTPLLAQGWVIAMSDYEGLGTPGPQPYLVGESEGRAVLDIARAAGEVVEEAGTSVTLVGISQGGHAVLFARQLATTWAPGIDLRGTVAVAPAVELPSLLDLLRTNEHRGLAALAVAGLSSVEPPLALGDVLTEEGERRLAEVDRVCALDIGERFTELPPEQLFRLDVPVSAPWAAAIARNSPGSLPGHGPLLLVHGELDGIVPVALVDRFADRLCARGEAVATSVYPGATHDGVVTAAAAEIASYVHARFRGDPPPSTC